MGRAPCCSKGGLHRGSWTSKEDSLLTSYITSHGEGHWRSLPKQAGLLRCGKSCRLRWMNYLRPDIKRGNITAQEDDLIIRLHSLLGNRWSLIAGRLPGRTDNEIKNHWNTRLGKKTPSSPSPSKKIFTTPTIPKKPPKKQSNFSAPEQLEIIETKHIVHKPKPVRLGSIRNMSVLVQTSESNNNNDTNNNTNIEYSSFSSSENNMSVYNCNKNSCSLEEGEQEGDHVAKLNVTLCNNNKVSDAAWGGDDNGMYTRLYGDEALSDDPFQAGNNSNNGVWERLCEEYLELPSDTGCQLEWQPHEESLFI